MQDCIFCKIARGEIPSNKIYEDELVLAFHDIAPQAPAHALVIPKAHMADLLEAAEQGDALLAHLMRTAALAARELKLDGTGFRIVANTGEHGAQSVRHFHIHVLGGRQLTGKMG